MAELLGDKLHSDFKWAGETKPIAKGNLEEMYLNNVCRA